MDRAALRRAQAVAALAEAEGRLLSPSEIEQVCDALTYAGLMYVSVRGDGVKVYRAKLEFARGRT